jgi:hypothetical protein
MIVQFRPITSRTSEDIAQRFREKAAALRSLVAVKIADAIVDASPVDTGTYIMAHVAGTEKSSEAPSRDSTEPGKIRGRNPNQFKNLARANLRRSVSADAILNSPEIFFRNRALHADKVEYVGWFNSGPAMGGFKEPYRVYSSARGRVETFIAEAASELGFDKP